jgi:hypothetical protein
VLASNKMFQSVRFARPSRAFLSMLFFAGSLFRAPGERIHLLPKYKQGATLRYRIEVRSNTQGHATTPIANPEGGTQLKQSASLVVRLDVLDVAPPGSPAANGGVRLRATYEQSSATSETDAYDPAATSLEDRMNQLEGRAFELTIDSDGKLKDVAGLEDLLANPPTSSAARSWISGLAPGSAFPKAGIVVGQKWSSETALAGSPLQGLAWHTESTYLRSEPCYSATLAEGGAPASKGKAAPEMCAVILTQFQILRRSNSKDPTPEDFRRNGLRTAGAWTGSGESLDSISILSGFLVNSTQTSSQQINLEITSARSGSKMRYDGHVDAKSQVSLLTEPAVAVGKQP